MSQQSTAQDTRDEGIQTVTTGGSDTDDDSLPDVFGNDAAGGIPSAVEELEKMGIRTDTARAGSKSRKVRKPKVSRRILQETDESLSDIFEEPLSPEFQNQDRTKKVTGSRDVLKEAELVTPYLLGVKKVSTPLKNGSIEGVDNLDEEMVEEALASDSEAVDKRAQVENGDAGSCTEGAGIGGSCEGGSPVCTRLEESIKKGTRRQEESGDEEMECGSVSSIDAEVPKREPAGKNGARRGVDASPDEGVVNSSENEEVSPASRSKSHDRTDDKSSIDKGEENGTDVDSEDVIDMVVNSPSKKLRNRTLVSSQSESEGGPTVGDDDDEVRKCREESKRNRLKVVIKPSPVKDGQLVPVDDDNECKEGSEKDRLEIVSKPSPVGDGELVPVDDIAEWKEGSEKDRLEIVSKSSPVGDGELVPVDDIAEGQEGSEKYLPETVLEPSPVGDGELVPVADVKKCKEGSKRNRLKVVIKHSPDKDGELVAVYAGDTSDSGEEPKKEENCRKGDDEKVEEVAVAGKDKGAAAKSSTSEEDGVGQKQREKVKIKKEHSSSDARSNGKRSPGKKKKKAEEKPSQDSTNDSSDDYASDFLQDFKGIRCTSCNEQLNQFNRKSLCKHPTLGVLICRRCIEYYHEGDFTKDECGSDEQCQWCGEGGNLICCDRCPSAFCKSCICRNLSRKEWTEISLNEDSEWSCYVCDKRPLRELTRNCKSVIRWAEKNKKKGPPKDSQESRERPAGVKPVSRQPARDRSLEQLQSFLTGMGKDWALLREKLDEGKKWAAKKQRKELVQAILNIRSLRKYFKAYQDHFEHCLEEIMSSGELSGGEAATDSGTAPEDSGSKENSQASSEGMDEVDSRVSETGGKVDNRTSKEKRREEEGQSSSKESSKEFGESSRTSKGKEMEGPIRSMDGSKESDRIGEVVREGTGDKVDSSESGENGQISKDRRREFPSDSGEDSKESEGMDKGVSGVTPQKGNRDKSVRRVKTTPKRPSKGSISEDDLSVIELDGDDSRITCASVTEIDDDSLMAADSPIHEDVGRDNQQGVEPGRGPEREMIEIGPAIGVSIVDDIGIVLDDDELNKGIKEKRVGGILPEKEKGYKSEEVRAGKPSAEHSGTGDIPTLGDIATKTGEKTTDADTGSKSEHSEVARQNLSDLVARLSDEVVADEEGSRTDDKETKKRKKRSPKDKSSTSSTRKSPKAKRRKSSEDRSSKGAATKQLFKEKEGKDTENDEEVDDFERLLMDEMGSDAEVGRKSDTALDSERSSDKELSREKGLKAKENLTKSHKKGTTRKSAPAYTEDGSTSGTEVSLIDVDLADVLTRKSKKTKRRPQNIESDSDTDAEIERMVKKSRKRKKKESSEEDQDSSEEDDGSSVKKEKSEKKKGSDKKRRRKESGASSSDLDDEIDRLDMVDLAGNGSIKREREKKSKKGNKERGGDEKEGTEKDSSAKEWSKKRRKKKEDSELSSSDDDFEELPEVNYDTDPEMFVNKEKEKKSHKKLENAEEDLAEERLREELDCDVAEKGGASGSSSDEKQSGEEGGKKSKGAGGRGGKRKGKAGQKGKASNDSDGDEGEDKSSRGERGSRSKKKSKVHKLLKSKLISSSSSSNSDEDWNPKKKKANDLLEKEEKSAEQKKRGKKKARGRKAKASDSDFTEGEDSSSDSSDSSVGKKKKASKTGKSGSRRNASQDSSSDDEIVRKVRKRKNRGKETQSDSDKGSSDDFAAERNKKRSYQKDRKKSRIKKIAASSNSETEADKEVVEVSGSDLEESPGKGKARKKIRKVMSKKKLTQSTKDAAEEERERRKRVLKRRQELIRSEMDSPQKSSVLHEVILDKDLKTKEVILEIDKKLVKVLKPHQAKGIQFMFDCTFETLADADKPGAGCILAHCMGLGKTLQVIAFLHTVMHNEKANVKTALVVAPLNTVFNWESEFEKWQENLDEVVDVWELASYKDNQSRADVLRQWQREGGVMIMGYTMYRNLCFSRFVKRKKQKETFQETLVDPGPDIVICDEGHLLKNDATATAKAMNNIRTRRRICLTGTPLQNNLIEYHCMVQFVKPQLLGTRKEFSNRFVNPISNGQCADSSPYDVKLMKKRAHILHNLLSGSVQRKDYSALAPYLPPKHEYVVLIRLSPKQIELYEKYLETHTGGQDTKGRVHSLFKDYQNLMNVWTHPRLLKLSAIRTEKSRQLAEMRSFLDDVDTDIDTSEEEEMNDNVRDSSSGDELMKTIKANQERIKKEAAVNGESKEGVKKKKKESDDSSSSGDDSDSSVEIVKAWNTRRTRKDGLEEEIPILPEPPKKRWFTDMVNNSDDLKIEVSGKLIVLFEVLKLAAAVGEKVLLFSQSLLTLDLIEDILEDQALKNVVDSAEKRSITLSTNQEIEIELETYDTWTKGMDYFRIDGSTDASIRKAMCDKFNDKENVRGRLFLLSTKAGSLGINLVAANRVIIFDACWNPSHDIQSIFRVYRFGQERAVYIYRFIAQGTMEERIYDRQVTKQSLAQRVVDEHQVKRHYTFTELNELYNFQPDRLDDPDREERPTPILPKDFILAELLHCQKDWIVKYHEHNSLLENVAHEGLTEEERKAAWTEYEAEKEGRMQQQMAANQDGFPPGMHPAMFRAPMMPPHPTMADQLAQMSRTHQQPRFNMAAQSAALRQIVQQANQTHMQQKKPLTVSQLSQMVRQANQYSPSPISLNDLFAMSSQMGYGPARMQGQPPPLQQYMGASGSNTMVQQPPPPLHRFGGPGGNSLLMGALNQGPPPRSQADAAYKNVTSQLIGQALAAPGAYGGLAPGQRAYPFPQNMPGTIPPVRPSRGPDNVNGEPE